MEARNSPLEEVRSSPRTVLCGLRALLLGLVLASFFVPARSGAAGAAPAPAATTASSDEASTAPTRKFSPEGEPLTTLVFSGNQKIDLILLKIKADTGVTVTAVGAAKGQQIPGPLLKDVTVKDALAWIAAQGKGWVYWEDKKTGNWFIADEAYYRDHVLKTQVVQRIIRPRNIPAADAHKAVERMITPNIGQITHDERTNQVIVTDLLPVVEAIERTIRLLDQKIFTRVFTIKHADPQEVLSILQEYKSPPGRLDLNAKMRQIIAVDTYENIQRMEVMVDILDRGPELRVYNLNNVDFEGQSIQDLQDYLSQDILTEGAYLKFDLQNGVMLLRDLPSVHEVVEKILKAVDQPARQVYIEAEIVETSYRHSFQYGIDYTIGDDLLVAQPSGGGGTTSLPSPGTGGGGGTGTTGGTGGTGLQPAQTNTTLGFTDVDSINAAAHALHERYPVFTGGSSGIVLDYLSRHARLNFNAVMSDTETKLLAQPRVLVKNRQPVDLTDGGTISYATTTYYGGGGYYGGAGGFGGYNPYIPSVGGNSVPTGVTLSVDPSVMNNGLIEMRVTLTNVTGTPVTRQLGGQEYTLVDTSNQSINTVLIIPDGQTRMIGGMIENRETETVSGIPFLKDIPIVGPVAFGNKKRSPVSRRTLLMFITATIVQEKVHEYAEPPDEDEMTAPTFYEQASWSAAAVRRAVEAGLAEIGQQLPELARPGGEPEQPKAEKTGRPMPTVRLTHEPTTPTAKTVAPPAPVTGPEKLPPVVPLEQIQPPETRPSEGLTTQPKAGTAPLPIEPTKPPAPLRPGRATGKPQAMGPRDLPLPPDTDEAALPSEFPSTGSIVVSRGPPRVLVGSRRPSDIPSPPLAVTAEATSAVETVATRPQKEIGFSSYNLVVVGPDGRAVGANLAGQRIEAPKLGTMPIPLKTLTTVVKPTPVRRTPVVGRRTPVRRTPIRRTPAVSVSTRRTPPSRPAGPSTRPPTRTPRNYRPPYSVRPTTTYGVRPPIYPYRPLGPRYPRR